LDPAKFVGRAPQQVDRFMQDVVEPTRQRYKGRLAAAVELKV
jgi:adenylosuccinate lyase